MTDATSNAQSASRDDTGILGFGSGTGETPPVGLALLSVVNLLAGGYLLQQGVRAEAFPGNVVVLGVGILSLLLGYGLWRRRYWAGTMAAVLYMLAAPVSLFRGGILEIAGPVVSAILVGYLWHLPDDLWR